MPVYRGPGGAGESSTTAAVNEVAGFANDALASANLSKQWAIEPEDTEVQPGLYSAFHWAQKAFEYYGGGSIITVSATAPVSPDVNDLWLDIS